MINTTFPLYFIINKERDREGSKEEKCDEYFENRKRPLWLNKKGERKCNLK